MEDIIEVSILDVQRHEEKTKANVRLGGYGMDACYRARLTRGDDDLMFVLPDFANHTKASSSRLRDVMQEAESLEGVASFMHGDDDRGSVDLRSATALELLIVCRELQVAPLVIYDGGHRAIAQYLTHRSISGVPAYVCVHWAINRWRYVPPQARE